jgi:hypothetical protein
MGRRAVSPSSVVATARHVGPGVGGVAVTSAVTRTARLGISISHKPIVKNKKTKCGEPDLDYSCTVKDYRYFLPEPTR